MNSIARLTLSWETLYSLLSCVESCFGSVPLSVAIDGDKNRLRTLHKTSKSVITSWDFQDKKGQLNLKRWLDWEIKVVGQEMGQNAYYVSLSHLVARQVPVQW